MATSESIFITSRNYDTDSFSSSSFNRCRETRAHVYDWSCCWTQTHVDGICSQGYRIFDGLDINGVARSFLTVWEDPHEHHLSFRSNPIDVFSIAILLVWISSRDTSNVHPVRIAIFFLDAIIAINIVIGINNLAVIPFTIINSGLLLCFFKSCFRLVFGFWRVRNTQYFMVDV